MTWTCVLGWNTCCWWRVPSKPWGFPARSANIVGRHGRWFCSIFSCRRRSQGYWTSGSASCGAWRFGEESYGRLKTPRGLLHWWNVTSNRIIRFWKEIFTFRLFLPHLGKIIGNHDVLPYMWRVYSEDEMMEEIHKIDVDWWDNQMALIDATFSLLAP